MKKTSLFKKCILTVATFSISMLLAVVPMLAPTTAKAEIVGEVGGVNSTFTYTISDFTVVEDSESSNGNGYTVVHRTAYEEAKFGKLNSSLDSDSDYGYAIVKTSPAADSQNIGVSAGLTTSSVTFHKDSFYRISVDINAQSASIYGGAVLKVDCEENDIYFFSGNNKFITTNSSWIKYTFFIATSQFEDIVGSISLTLGDTDGTKCIGYAAFDNLTVDLVDFRSFASALVTSKNDPTSYAEDFRRDLKEPVEDFNSASYTFDDGIYAYKESTDGPNLNKVDGNKSLAIANREVGVSSYGVVSINKNKPFEFDKVTSPQSGFYLVMIRTKAESDFVGTASVTLNYKSSDSVVDSYETFSIGGINDLPNECHNGWKTNYFIIKGSVISKNIGYITVEYGNASSLSKGTLLIDDIDILEIDFATYGKYSSSLTTASVICDLDADLQDATGVNGAFYKLRTDHYDVLRPDLWSISHNSNDVNYELVSKESIGYSFTESIYEIDTKNPVGNVVKIASNTDTIFSIDSQAVEIQSSSEDSYYKVTVLLTTKNLSGAGGVTLALVDTNGTPYGAIKIKENLKPTLCTFYIKAKDSAAFYVRCSLGDNTYGNTLSAKGELYIARINYIRSSKEEYDNNRGAKYSDTINFYYDNFNDFTLYNKFDQSDIKDAGTLIATVENKSTGSAKHGIVVIGDVNKAGHSMASTAISYGMYNSSLDPYRFGEEILERTYGFSAQNTNATLTINNAKSLSLPANDETDEETNASYYYKVVVSARAIVTGDYGLTIGLKTTDGTVISAISDIKDTRVYDDEGKIIRDQFVDFEFFVKLNDESVTVQIFMTFGGEKHIQKTSGFVLFQGYELTSTYETAYDKAVENTAGGAQHYDKETGTYKYTTTADLSVEKEEGKTTEGTSYNPNDTWYYVPSILFAVLIIVALAGYFIKKLTEKAKAKKEAQNKAKDIKTPDYATRIDYSKEEEKQEEKQEEKIDVFATINTEDGNLDEFDEDYDMYAVHEVVDPTKIKKEEVSATPVVEEVTVTPVVEEEKQEVKEEKPEQVKPSSDEFDD